MENDHPPKEVFVFGSNLAGIHGAGAALFAAKKLGAESGIGEGPTGECYAIPTKNRQILTRPMEHIEKSIFVFQLYAAWMLSRNQTFKVTCIGCGLAGLKHEDIAPLFKNSPKNCKFDTLWKPYLDINGVEREYWGTF